MSLQIYMNFDGNTKEVVETYAKIFNAPVPEIMYFKDMPPDPERPPLPESALNLVVHAQLQVAGSTLMFSDIFPGMSYTLGNHISIMLGLADVDELKRVFEALSENGFVSMPLQETFFSKCYGQLIDRFGISWQFIAE